jgi:hypothetical protein
LNYGSYGVTCKNCGGLVGGFSNSCQCGSIKIRKLRSEDGDGLVIYTTSPKVVDKVVEIYYDSSGSIKACFPIGPLSVGKSVFLELEPRLKDYKMYHKKLPCEVVVDIITRYLSGETQQSLADEYGVSKKEVYNIVYRVIRKDCPLPDEISGDKYRELVSERARLRIKEQNRELP